MLVADWILIFILEVFLMYRTKIKFERGCLGSKVFIHPENRSIDLAHVKVLLKNLEQVAKTRPDIELIKIKGKLYILDGQHTITAISEFSEEPVSLDVKVFEENEIPSVPEYLAAKHKGKIWRRRDDFKISSNRSKWPEVAARRGLEVVYSHTSKRVLTWCSLLDAVAASDRSLQTGLITRPQSKAHAGVAFDLWINAPIQEIDLNIRGAKWWEGLHNAAMKRRNLSLFGADLISLGLYLYKKYGNDVLEINPDVFASDERLTNVRAALSYDITIPNLMHAINYKRHGNLFEIDGKTGR